MVLAPAPGSLRCQCPPSKLPPAGDEIIVRHHHWSAAWLVLVLSIATAACRGKSDAPATQPDWGSPAAAKPDEQAPAAPAAPAQGLWDVSALVDQVRPVVV